MVRKRKGSQRASSQPPEGPVNGAASRPQRAQQQEPRPQGQQEGPSGAERPQGQPAAAGTAPVGAGPAANGAAATAAVAAAAGKAPRNPALLERLHAVACAVAAWLLLLFPRAALHILSPQTGDWLAGLCANTLLAVGVAAAAVGVTAVTAWRSLGLPLRGGPGGAAAAGAALWAAAALALAGKPLAQAAGGVLLAPGLSLDESQRVTDTWLTLRGLALALLSFGPPMACLGFAAGHSGSQALLPLHPYAHLLLAPALGVLGVRATLLGGPGPTLPKPGCTIPAVVAALAALLAAALGEAAQPANSSPAAAGGAAAAAAAASPSQPGGGRPPPAAKATKKSNKRGVGPAASSSGVAVASVARWAAAAAVAALAAAQVTAGCYPCRAYDPPAELAGGQYRLLYSCQAWLGGYVSVFEGILSGKYRYRLLRVDHSIVGGEYVAPPEVAGQSVYTAFYLQQAILAARPINGSSSSGGGSSSAPGEAEQKPRSLHIGLGVGTTMKGLQQAGTVADVLELHGEVAHAAAAYFGARPAGRTLVGDALAGVGSLPDESYDYVIHDVFSGGGAAPPLMREAFFRRLRRKMRPGGVVAVNYMGSRGQPLKQLWCRLRLAFDHVRSFGDQERGRVKNYVIFASDTPLDRMEATGALLANGSLPGAQGWDPPALDALRTLGRAEVKFTFDRQRCIAFLGLEEEYRAAARERLRREKKAAGAGAGLLHGTGMNLPPGARQAVAGAGTEGAAAAAAQASRGSGSGAPWFGGREAEELPGLPAQFRPDPQRSGAPPEPPPRRQWAVERWKEEAARGHALASYHWGVMRRQFDDELWRAY